MAIVFGAVVGDDDAAAAAAAAAACWRRSLVAAVRWLARFPSGDAVVDGSAGIGGRASTLSHRPFFFIRRGRVPVSLPARERLRSSVFATACCEFL